MSTILIPAVGLPGVKVRRVPSWATKPGVTWEDVFQDGNYIGTIMYEGRKLAGGGTEYGWRPNQSRFRKLTTKKDAIMRLPNYRRTQETS